MRSRADNDFATPLRRDTRSVALEIDGRAVAVPEGTSVIRAAAEAGHPHPETLRDRFAGAVRLMPFVPGRNRRPARLPRLVHDARARRDESAHREPGARAPASRRNGVVHFGSSARLPDLSRQRQLRTAGHGGRGRSARGALSQRRRREPSACGEGRVESVFHFRSVEMHRVLAMRPRVRGSAGHVRTDDRRARIFVGDLAGTERSVRGVRMRFVRRLRAGMSDRDVDGKIGGRTRTAGSQRRHDLRILRRRVLIPRRDERRPRRAHGAESQRSGQSRSLVRQGPLRVGLHDASRSRHASADSQIDRRAVARGVLARSDRIRRVGVQAHPG